jgi:hypothetical protein
LNSIPQSSSLQYSHYPNSAVHSTVYIFVNPLRSTVLPFPLWVKTLNERENWKGIFTEKLLTISEMPWILWVLKFGEACILYNNMKLHFWQHYLKTYLKKVISSLNGIWNIWSYNMFSGLKQYMYIKVLRNILHK